MGCHVLKNVLDESPPLDVVLSCKDGRVGAHRAVLVAASPLIACLLKHRVSLGELMDGSNRVHDQNLFFLFSTNRLRVKLLY